MTGPVRPEQRRVPVIDTEVAFVEAGEGSPVVFLHGNPTSSHLWRHVIPPCTSEARCIAPDLIGMGDSDKLENSGPDRYTFAEHREYLDTFFEQLDVTENVTLVIHDWGSALGFDWANRHRDAVKGIAYMEAIVVPLTWDDWPEAARKVFQGFRSPAGEGMVLEKNIFVERILPASVLRGLTEEELAHYRAPYLEAGEDRRATLTWPREVPFAGEPADTHDVIAAYADWLPGTEEIPKLWIDVSEGVLIAGARREFAASLPSQKVVRVEGRHFIQEDAPDEIGAAIAEWLGGL